MPVSDILEIPVLTETMAQKTIGVNMAIQAMEKAIAGKLEINTDDATVSGYDLEIPFDTTNDLSGREALRAIYYLLEAGATQNFELIHPPNPHLFFIKNETTRVATVRTDVGGTGGDTVNVPAGALYMIYCDGFHMQRINFTILNLTQAHDFNVSFWGMPEDGQVIARFLIGRDTTFPANFAGSVGRVGTNPLVDRDFSVWDDATNFGTITIEDDGSFDFSTSGGVARTVAAGSVLQIINQAGAPDTLLTDIEFVLLGTVVVSQPNP